MVEIRCEDDLWRHYARDPFWLKSYIMEDNSTCISPPDATGGFHAPGYGGAYAGSKVRCAAAHDLRAAAQPDACKPKESGRPPQPGTSMEDFESWPKAPARDGWDWVADSLPRRRG